MAQCILAVRTTALLSSMKNHPCQCGGVELFRENAQIGHIGHVPWTGHDQAMEAMEKPIVFRTHDLLSHETGFSPCPFQTFGNFPRYWPDMLAWITHKGTCAAALQTRTCSEVISNGGKPV